MKRIAIKNICEVYDGPHATPKKTETGPVYLGIDAITEDGMLDSSQFRMKQRWENMRLFQEAFMVVLVDDLQLLE